MTKARATHGTGFLTVAEAAERLGQSRLRVREAAAKGTLPSRRDNEGRLRVDIPDKLKGKRRKLDPDAIVGLLFDELEELQSTLDEKNETLDRLTELAERQSAALDQADQALDAGATREANLSGLLERALSHLEHSEDQTARLAAVSRQALNQLDRVGTDLEASLSQSARFDLLLERTIAVAERDAKANPAPNLAPAAERAFDMLDAALSRAEAAQAANDKSAALLDRALATGESLQLRLIDQEKTILSQEKTVETALEMSERAIKAATDASAEPPRKRGFLRWLFGT